MSEEYRETSPRTRDTRAIWKDALTHWTSGQAGIRNGRSTWQRGEPRPEQEHWKLLDGFSSTRPRKRSVLVRRERIEPPSPTGYAPPLDSTRYERVAGLARRAVGVQRNPCRLTGSACGPARSSPHGAFPGSAHFSSSALFLRCAGSRASTAQLSVRYSGTTERLRPRTGSPGPRVRVSGSGSPGRRGRTRHADERHDSARACS